MISVLGKRIVVIGAGFAGLAAACRLAKAGGDVVVLEKNDDTGGRVRLWEKDGFVFDMGPSWYWMPDVFELFFARFGKKPSDYYDLVRLNPSYRVVFGRDSIVDLPAGIEGVERLFESIEPDSGPPLRRFLADAEYKYRVGMSEYVRRPSLSPAEFLDARLIGSALRLQMLQSMRRHVAAYFRDPRLVQIMEFPVLFLGGTAQQIPAMYSLMNWADIALGTWYPMGGMARVADSMVKLAESLGVRFRTGIEAQVIVVEKGAVSGVETNQGMVPADYVVATGDYHHMEQKLLAPQWRTYSEDWWDQRTMSPSSLLFYLGVNKRLKNLRHHNLFFDEGLDQHAREIYDTPRWPSKPLFYACCPSLTDPGVAPEGCENLFLLVPVAAGLEDSEEIRERYFGIVMDRLEALTGQSIRESVIVKRSYAHRDFMADYHAYKGNAYGLANTLRQTAFLKPRMKSTKVRNLYFAGQLTVPGPGVPPAIISGEMAAGLLLQSD